MVRVGFHEFRLLSIELAGQVRSYLAFQTPKKGARDLRFWPLNSGNPCLSVSQCNENDCPCSPPTEDRDQTNFRPLPHQTIETTKP